MNRKNKIMLTAAAAGVLTLGVAAIGVARPYLTLADNDTTIQCGAYQTKLADNISHEKIVASLDLVPTDQGTMAFNIANPENYSGIVTTISAANAQIYRYEIDTKTKQKVKEGYESWKFGTGSKAGSISFTLSKPIKAVGFYAVAYANTKDVGKYVTVNGVDDSTPLIAAESYDGGEDQRHFVELSQPSDAITIAAKTASNNRFYLYSVGFYF